MFSENVIVPSAHRYPGDEKSATPYTLGLVIVGLVISLLGLLPVVRLSPQLVLFVFLLTLLLSPFVVVR